MPKSCRPQLVSTQEPTTKSCSQQHISKKRFRQEEVETRKKIRILSEGAVTMDEIMREIHNHTLGRECKWQSPAIRAIQLGAETYLAEVLKEAKQCATLSKRDTVTHQDICLIRRLHGPN